MKTVVKLVRIFLASPGDLPEERKLVKDTEDELNSVVAAHWGYRIELKGWEDTLSSVGRPQSIINQELDLCELFIGLMYKRWGSPPSSEGTYTSGFQEEFERSLHRRARTGSPEMAMYFKRIESDYLQDPGKDLEQVLAFKERIKNEKTIYYEEFNTPYDLQRRVRMKIQKYLADLATASEEEEIEEQAGTKVQEKGTSQPQEPDVSTSLLAAKGHQFISNLLEKMHAADSVKSIDAVEIARFRLLANALSKRGNDEPRLGVHDANILFAHKDLDLGSAEIAALFECGLQHIAQENVPVWRWYKASGGLANKPLLPLKTFKDEAVAVGALEVMRLLGPMLPKDEPIIDREFFIRHWLEEAGSEDVKLAGLRYLKHHGRMEDARYVEAELAKEDMRTSRTALEALVSIELRNDKCAALQRAFSNQFESFDEGLLDELLSSSAELDSQTVAIGLEHNNVRIRLESVRTMVAKGGLSESQIQLLKNDPAAEVRAEVVKALVVNGGALSDEEVQQILVKPNRRGSLGVLKQGNVDWEGQAEYERYLFRISCQMTEKHLTDIVKQRTIGAYDAAYFALCKRYFKKYGDDLRKNVDDQFKEIFEAVNEAHIQATDDQQGLRNIEDFMRKEWTRKGLDVLCEMRDVQDIGRVRANMSQGYTDSSKTELRYLAKCGEWRDIPSIVKTKDHGGAMQPVLFSLSRNREWYGLVAAAVYQIGGERLDELLQIEMPYQVLGNVVGQCPCAKLSALSDNLVLELLNHRNDRVRRTVALRCVQCFTKTRIGSLLAQYVEGLEYRYYNVRVWLDLGVSIPRVKAKRAAKNVLDEMLRHGL